MTQREVFVFLIFLELLLPISKYRQNDGATLLGQDRILQKSLWISDEIDT
jgi:hypothetical protein